MGSLGRPEYVVYPDKISETLTMYQASVYIRGGASVSFRNYRFMGRAMPTERHAIQMAAREAIARLRDILPVMQNRPYYYLPCHVPYTSHYAFSCTIGERDLAIEPLVQYIMASESTFTSLVDDYLTARMDLSRARVIRRSEYRSPSPRAPRTSTTPNIPLANPATQRSTPTGDASRPAAPIPTRASPLTSTVPPPAGTASTTTRLEAILEEEEEEGDITSWVPCLSLTLSRT